MDVELPDGTVIQGVPDGMSRADLVAKLKANGHDTSGMEPPAKEPSAFEKVKAAGGKVVDAYNNYGLGWVRGAGSIGATALAPVDAAARAMGVQNDFIGRDDRRQSMTDATQTLGADPNSLPYKAGKLSAEVSGTAGAGGVLANAARGAGAAPAFVNALASNGFRTGAALPAAQNLAVRSAGGALSGGAQVGMADPEHAGAGAVIGGALPGAAKAVGALGGAANDAGRAVAERLMESALKPTLKQKQTGDAAIAVQELLDRGINPTKGGVQKIKGLIGDLNDQIATKIAGSNAMIDPQKVTNALASTRTKFGNQVDPTADLAAIDKTEQGFLSNAGAGDIPVSLAQKVKQGTYSVLRGKYGQMGSAETEAQKGLARGLKDEIAAAVPEVAPLNAQESRLLSTLSVTERRAMMDVNKNPLGLAALAVHEPTAFIAFMADKSAAFKSLAARAINAASTPLNSPPALNALAGPAAYRLSGAAPRALQQQP